MAVSGSRGLAGGRAVRARWRRGPGEDWRPRKSKRGSDGEGNKFSALWW